MKCIKSKCRFYKEHDFFSSAYVCSLGGSFKKDGKNIECVLDVRLKELEREKELLEKYSKFIRFKQPK